MHCQKLRKLEKNLKIENFSFRLDFSNKSAQEVHNFIRGLDSAFGAWTLINGEEIRLYGSKIWDQKIPEGDQVDVDGHIGIVHEDGLLIKIDKNNSVNIERLKIGNRTIIASKFGKQSDNNQSIEFTPEEAGKVDTARSIWESILKMEIYDGTDFFASGKETLRF